MMVLSLFPPFTSPRLLDWRIRVALAGLARRSPRIQPFSHPIGVNNFLPHSTKSLVLGSPDFPPAPG